MCGIVGYTGKDNAVPILLEGLRRLEYRGYDSAGITVINNSNELLRRRCKGKIVKLQEILFKEPIEGKTAIGHTRWATHGKPSDENAHPHIDCTNKISIVHNGIIENYADLKKRLVQSKHSFSSETDTEVIVHELESNLSNKDNMLAAFKITLDSLEGSYALGAVSTFNPKIIFAARKDSPLIIGLSDSGNFIASDVPAILPYTNRIIYLEDGDIAKIEPDKVTIFDSSLEEIKRPESRVNWNPVMAEKQGFKHFMLKEIHEQQRAIQETLAGRINWDSGEILLDNFHISREQVKDINRIYIVGCGTAYHAGLVGKFLLEDTLKTPCEVDIASEFRYRRPPIDKNTLVLAISQSGETADTLAALREAKKCKAMTAVICNVIGSTITRETENIIYTHAGPEIGVASTKAFTTQLTALYMLTIFLGRSLGAISDGYILKISHNLMKIPNEINRLLASQEKLIENIAHTYFKKSDFLFIGRNINYPIALEGALKLKEISYIHAEGYPAGELKHGPIALIDEEMPIVAIATQSSVYDKITSNIMEVKARGGHVIALATSGNSEIKNYADEIIFIPETDEILYPILNTVPLQLLAYYIAKFRGCDIDQPRNLAKSVTVE